MILRSEYTLPVKQIPLREARKNRHLTQEQLEALSGVNQGVISRLEQGVIKDPASSTLLSLAAALKIDPRVLCFGHEANS